MMMIYILFTIYTFLFILNKIGNSRRRKRKPKQCLSENVVLFKTNAKMNKNKKRKEKKTMRIMIKSKSVKREKHKYMFYFHFS